MLHPNQYQKKYTYIQPKTAGVGTGGRGEQDISEKGSGNEQGSGEKGYNILEVEPGIRGGKCCKILEKGPGNGRRVR